MGGARKESAHLSELPAQIGYLVSDAGRILEAEVFCGLVHLLF